MNPENASFDACIVLDFVYIAEFGAVVIIASIFVFVSIGVTAAPSIV